MPPYEKQLLEKTAKLSEENNKILHHLQSNARWARLFFLTKWLLILGIAIGAYYYIQPYIDALIQTYNGIQNATGGQAIEVPTGGEIETKIKNLLGL